MICALPFTNHFFPSSLYLTDSLSRSAQFKLQISVRKVPRSICLLSVSCPRSFSQFSATRGHKVRGYTEAIPPRVGSFRAGRFAGRTGRRRVPLRREQIAPKLTHESLRQTMQGGFSRLTEAKNFKNEPASILCSTLLPFRKVRFVN